MKKMLYLSQGIANCFYNVAGKNLSADKLQLCLLTLLDAAPTRMLGFSFNNNLFLLSNLFRVFKYLSKYFESFCINKFNKISKTT